MNTDKKFNAVYILDEVPWVFKETPKELVELVEKGKIKPCKTLEVGCGVGYCSIYFASKGFQITGIDWSEKAIEMVMGNAEEAGVSVKFIQMDIKNVNMLKEKFGFIFDWRFLHDIVDEEDRKKYAENIGMMLNSNGKYLSVYFNEKSILFGKGKFRRNPRFGIDLHFASMEDIENLFNPYFNIKEKRIFIS